AGAEIAAGLLVVKRAWLALLAHARENLLLFEWNAKLLVGAENLRVDISERLRRFKCLWRGVVVDVLVIDCRIVHAPPRRAPRRLAPRQPAAIGLEAPGQHPVRLVLLARYETDRIFRQSLRGFLGFDLGLETILVLINVDTADLIDGLSYGRHSSLRSRLQGP